MKQKKINFWLALVFIIFGVITVISGGRSLFTVAGFNSRGQIVPVVLWYNFVAGFFYIIVGISTFKLKSCAKKVSAILAISSIIVLIYLINYIFQGGIYENKTLFAMSFRTIFWTIFAIYLKKSNLFNQSECKC